MNANIQAAIISLLGLYEESGGQRSPLARALDVAETSFYRQTGIRIPPRYPALRYNSQFFPEVPMTQRPTVTITPGRRTPNPQAVRPGEYGYSEAEITDSDSVILTAAVFSDADPDFDPFGETEFLTDPDKDYNPTANQYLDSTNIAEIFIADPTKPYQPNQDQPNYNPYLTTISRAEIFITDPAKPHQPDQDQPDYNPYLDSTSRAEKFITDPTKPYQPNQDQPNYNPYRNSEPFTKRFLTNPENEYNPNDNPYLNSERFANKFLDDPTEPYDPDEFLDNQNNRNPKYNPYLGGEDIAEIFIKYPDKPHQDDETLPDYNPYLSELFANIAAYDLTPRDQANIQVDMIVNALSNVLTDPEIVGGAFKMLNPERVDINEFEPKEATGILSNEPLFRPNLRIAGTPNNDNPPNDDFSLKDDFNIKSISINSIETASFRSQLEYQLPYSSFGLLDFELVTQ